MMKDTQHLETKLASINHLSPASCSVILSLRMQLVNAMERAYKTYLASIWRISIQKCVSMSNGLRHEIQCQKA